ncbi:MAG: RHS repeat protein, partial [Burkholderiales bacterium]
MSVSRSYRSQVTGSFAGLSSLAAHWHLGISSLTVRADDLLATLTLGDGSVRRFSRLSNSAAWVSDTTATEQFTSITLPTGSAFGSFAGAPGYSYTSGSNDGAYLFTSAGQILRHSQRNGWAMSYAYNASNQLASISNHFGRSLALAYHASGNPSGSPAGLLASITTPDGQLISYEYDSASRMIRASYPGNISKQYLYENTTFPHLLTGVMDENAIRLSTYSYDASGRAIETTKANSVDRYQVSYGTSGGSGASGNAITSATITDPLGTPRTYNYATSLSQLAVTGADKPSGLGLRDAASRVQDSLGFITSETDFLGITSAYQWDTTRRLKTSETLAVGRPEQQTVSTQWHPTLRLPALVTEAGKTTAYTYDAAGNILTQTETDTTGNASNGQVRTWSYTYNASSQLTAMTDPRGQIWAYTYNAAGQRASSTNPLGHVSTSTYDGAGRMLTETAPSANNTGLVTSYQYDARGRVTRIARGSNLPAAQQQITLYTYKPSGQIASAILPNGHAISYTYDSAQRLVAATDNRGNQITYTLDPMGNRISEQIKDASNQIALASSRVINSLNRVEAIKGGTNPSAQTTALQYDANGNPIKTIDPLGNATQTTLDALRRPIATVLPDGSQSDQYYNQLNQLTAAIDPKDVQTSYVRNAWGEVLSESSPDIGQIATTRDALGNALSMTDAKGQTTSYQYDALSRVSSITFADGKQHSFFYDGTAAGQQIGSLREMQDPSGNTKYERDAFSRITKKTQTVLDNPTAPTVLITSYTYTAAGDVASIRYPSGLTVGYQFSASGQISGITTKIGTAAALPFLQNLSYTALGAPKAWSWAHCTAASNAIAPCTSASRSFDADGRMMASSIAAYQYDANSRITGITQNLQAQRSVTSTSG